VIIGKKTIYKTINLCLNKHVNYLNFLYGFYYALLDLKKVVISTYFNVTIYIEFELFNY
jgi:hypothetical protein